VPVPATEENLRYLIAKRDRLGHQLDNLCLPTSNASAPVMPSIPKPDISAPFIPNGSGSGAAPAPPAASAGTASPPAAPRQAEPADPAPPAPPAQAPR
jgi:hypothetical protein